MSPKRPSDVEKIAVLKQRVSTLTHLAKVQRRLLQDAERRADHWREEAEEAREALEAIAAELSEVEETEEPSDNGRLDEGLGQDHASPRCRRERLGRRENTRGESQEDDHAAQGPQELAGRLGLEGFDPSIR
jgi:predicted  nucleic acid-binding Zn-ribbon protein